MKRNVLKKIRLVTPTLLSRTFLLFMVSTILSTVPLFVLSTRAADKDILSSASITPSRLLSLNSGVNSTTETITLSSKPAGTISFQLSTTGLADTNKNNVGDITISPSSFTLSSSKLSQTVTYTVPKNVSASAGLVVANVTFSDGSPATKYNFASIFAGGALSGITGLAPVFTPSKLTYTYGRADTQSFTVAMSSKPTDTIVYNISLTPDPGFNPVASIDKTSITFNPSNWSVPQTVTITYDAGYNYLSGDSTQTPAVSFKTQLPQYNGNLYINLTGTPPAGATAPQAGMPKDTSKNEQISLDNLTSLLSGGSVSLTGSVPVVIGWFLTVIALAAFLALLYSGFLYISAGGDAGRVETARKNITWAITGLVLSLVALLIVALVPRLLTGGLSTVGSGGSGSGTGGSGSGSGTTLSYSLTDPSGATVSDTAIGDASRKDFSMPVCVKLPSTPTQTDSIAVSSDGDLPLVVSASQVNITAANWNTPQCVTVSYKGDGQAGQAGEVLFKYGSDTAQRLRFTTNGATSGGVLFVDINGNPTTSFTETNDFTPVFGVKLAAQPSSSVTLTISFSGNLMTEFGPTTMTFDSTNWSTVQYVSTRMSDSATSGQSAVLTAVNKATDQSYSATITYKP